MDDEIKVYVIGENNSGYSLAALMEAYQSLQHQHIDFVVAPKMARKIERRLIEPHEKPSKMYNTIRCVPFPEMLYCEPLPEEKELTPTIPLPTSHGTNKKKFLPTVNVEKSEATRLKNRKKRKSKKRK